MTRCDCCHDVKDLFALETYPFEGDGIDTSELIEPLLSLHVRGEDGYRACVVCHSCYHRLDPDLWMAKERWESFKPMTPYSELPKAATKDGTP